MGNSETIGSTTDRDMLQEQYRHLLVAVMPSILSLMLARNYIDKNREYTHDELWDIVVNAPDEFTDDLRMSINLEDEFYDSARTAANVRSLEVAIVLIAIVIEHKLNAFYRTLLQCSGLSDEETTQAIKSMSFDEKTGWFLSYCSEYRLPEGILKEIAEVVEIRNALVHYKFIPSNINEENYWYRLNSRIKCFDPDRLLTLPQRLDDELEKILENRFDWYMVTKKWCRIMFDE